MDSIRRKPLGFQQFAAGQINSAQTLTVPAGTTHLVLQCEVQAMRWRDDGTAPTTAIGMLLPVNTYFEYSSSPGALQIISAVAGGVLNVSYYNEAGNG